MSIRIGVVTVSDRAFRGEYEDRGGPAVIAWLQAALQSDWTAVPALVPDEIDRVDAVLRRLCDEERCPLVLTTGGTGPARRDITPEATAQVCHRVLDGFGEQMRSASLQVVPTAILSRQIAGTRGSSLIINLPGNPSAVADCLDAVFSAVPWCIELLEGPRIETNPEVCSAYRPPQA
ncbi:MAG: molybdopterin adenylyltransferase [Phycisphaerales bacterium]|nr:molybdopterin adenylyltransferase [Phycisphaerales bacterium]